jgi:hypothetical protein
MPDHYHRRPVTLSRAIERLMLLDDVLASAELTWLVTEAEKIAHFSHLSSSSADILPRTFVRPGTAQSRITFLTSCRLASPAMDG